MKRFFITTFALTLFSTASVFGASFNLNSQGNKFIRFNINRIKCNSQNNNENNNTNQPSNDDNVNNNVDNNTNETIENENNISSISEIEQEVVRLVNLERQKEGLKPLTIDTELSKVARLKSEDMKNKMYFSHTSPTYGTPFDMLKQFNISYKSAGENIAKGQKTAQAVVDAWMNSEGHRKNILSSSFTHIGVGHSSSYWTQLFISK